MSKPNGGIKLQLDIVIGESNEIESTDKTKLEDIAQRVKDLGSRLKDIRREQVFQRVSPPPFPFRDSMRAIMAGANINTGTGG